MMDDASSSKSDGEEEWMDLSKSDYAKVIFSNLYWNSLSGDVGCLFSLTQTVSKNPSDYIGIYKVGYDNLSQCLAMKKLSEFAYDTKPIHCGFKAEELPELNGFYQFLYVTHEKEVCGASMPFEVKQKKEDDEVVTERIENDFLIVRYGLEQKNQKLNTLLKTYEAENVVLVAKIRELRGEKGALTQKLEETEPLLNSATQELEQLKDEHLALAKELEFTRDKEAKILSILDATEKDFDREVKKAEVLLQLKRDVESMYENAVAENKAISLEFEEKVKEKEVLIAESNKIIEELSEEVKFKQIFIEKIIQESFDLTKARDVTLEEYKKRVDQLTLQVEKLTLERASKEKLLKDQWSRDKEEKYNLMEIDLQNALSQKHALEKEATQLRKYLKNPEEYMRQPTLTFNHMMPAGEKVTDEYLMEQLNDAKFMIKALEDSKQLAMKEMHELSEKLKKTKEELSQMRCENMALKIFLEEKSSSVNLLSKLKETDPSVDMDNFETKVMDLIAHERQQIEEINKGKAELSLLRCENMALKIFLEEKESCETGGSTGDHEQEIPINNVLKNLLLMLKDPTADLDIIEEKLKESVINVQHEEIKKLKEECKRKDEEIESLNEKLNTQQRTTVDAIMNAEDKTARIVQAAELYKDLYKEKEKLAKQLRKLTLMKSRSKRTSISSTQDNLKPSFLALNIEKACSETSSNNSDSDTGEHVRASCSSLKEDEIPLPQAMMSDKTEVMSHTDINSLDIAINNLCAAVKEDQEYKPPPKTESLCLQLSPVEEDTHIPCVICGKSFLITAHSNIPMIEHIEKEHNMDICPLCGQLFDKAFPSKYLLFHVNDHFQSE